MLICRTRLLPILVVLCVGLGYDAVQPRDALAQDAAVRPWPPPPPWPEQVTSDRVPQLCMVISTKLDDWDPGSPHIHMYQQIIHYMAGADPLSHSEDEVRSRIQKWWKENLHRLYCESFGFNVDRGNVIKYAVSNSFDDFIQDVTDWGVELNRVDPGDSATALDYVRDEIARLKGSVLEPKLKRYYIILREAGALHREELPAR